MATRDAKPTPPAERLRLDRRIHNQRRTLHELWKTGDQRIAGNHFYARRAWAALLRMCDAAGIPRRSEDGIGYMSAPWRVKQLEAFVAQAIEARSDETGTGSARQGESAVP